MATERNGSPQDILERLRQISQQTSQPAKFQSKRYTPPTQGVRDRQFGLHDARIAALRDNPAMRPLIDEIAAGKPQQATSLGALGSAVFNSLPVKMVLGGIGVVDTGRRAVISGVREAVDLFDSDPATKASFSDFFNQTKDTSYGFGTAFPMEGWGGRVLGFVGDVLLDPITYATLGATIPKKALSEVVEGGARLATRQLIGTKYLIGADARFSLARVAKQMGASDDVVKSIAARGRRAVPEDIAARMGLNRSGIYYFGSRVRVPFSGPLADAISAGLVKGRLSFFGTRAGEKIGRAMTKTGTQEGVNTAPYRFELATGRIADSKVASDLVTAQNAENTRRAWSGIGEDNALKTFRPLIEDPSIVPYRHTLYRFLSQPESTWAQIAGDAASPEIVAAQRVREIFDGFINDILQEGRKVDPNLKIGVIEDGYFPLMATDAALNAAQDSASPYALQIREYLKMDVTDATGSFRPRGLKEGSDFFGVTLTADDVARGIDRFNEISMERAGFKMFETDLFEVAKRYSRNYGNQIGTFKYLQELVDAGVVRPRGAAYQVSEETLKAAQEAVEAASKTVDSSAKALRSATAGVVRSLDEALGKVSGTQAAVAKKATTELAKVPDGATAKQVLDGAAAAFDDRIAAAERAWVDFLEQFDDVGAEVNMLGQLHAEALAEYQQVSEGLKSLADEAAASWSAKVSDVPALEQKYKAVKQAATRADAKGKQLENKMAQLAKVQSETADWFKGFYDDPEGFLRIFDDPEMLLSKFRASSTLTPDDKRNIKHAAFPGGAKATFARWAGKDATPEIRALRAEIDPKGRFKAANLERLKFVDDANPADSVQHIIASGFSSAADLEQLRRVAVWQVARETAANPAALSDTVFRSEVDEIKRFIVAAEAIEDILRGTSSRQPTEAMLRPTAEISGLRRTVDIDNRLAALADEQEELVGAISKMENTIAAAEAAPRVTAVGELSGQELVKEWQRILKVQLTGATDQEVLDVAKQMAAAGQQPQAPKVLRSSLRRGAPDPEASMAVREMANAVQGSDMPAMRSNLDKATKRLAEIEKTVDELSREKKAIFGGMRDAEGVLLAQKHLSGQDGGVVGLVQKMGELMSVRHIRSLSDIRFRQMAIMADAIGMAPTQQMHDVLVASVARPLAEEAISAEARLGKAASVLRDIQERVTRETLLPDRTGNETGYRAKNELVKVLREIFEEEKFKTEAGLLREFFPEIEAVLSNYMSGASSRVGRAFFADGEGERMAIEVARVMDEIMPGQRKWSLGEMERTRGVNRGGKILSDGGDIGMGPQRSKSVRSQLEKFGLEDNQSINIIDAFSSGDAVTYDRAWGLLNEDIKRLEQLVETKRIPGESVPKSVSVKPAKGSSWERQQILAGNYQDEMSIKVSKLVESAKFMRDKIAAAKTYTEFGSKIEYAYNEAVAIANELSDVLGRLAATKKTLGKADFSGVRVKTLEAEVKRLEAEFERVFAGIEASDVQVSAALKVLGEFGIRVNESVRRAKLLAKKTEPLAATKDRRVQRRIMENISKNAAGFGVASHLRRAFYSSRDAQVKDFFSHLLGGTVFDPSQGYASSRIVGGKLMAKNNVQEVYTSIRVDPNNPGRFVDPAGNRVNLANERLDDAGRVLGKNGKPLTKAQEAKIPQNQRSSKLLMGEGSSRPTKDILPENSYLAIAQSGAARRKMLFGFLAEESGAAFSGSSPASSILRAADAAALGAADFSASGSSQLGPRAFARRLDLFVEELEEALSSATGIRAEVLKTEKGLKEAEASLLKAKAKPGYRVAVARRKYFREQARNLLRKHDEIVNSQVPMKIDGKEVIYSAAQARQEFHSVLYKLARLDFEDYLELAAAKRMPQLSRAEFDAVFGTRLNAAETAGLVEEYQSLGVLLQDAIERLRAVQSRRAPTTARGLEARRLTVAEIEDEISQLRGRRAEIGAEQKVRGERGRDSAEFWSGLGKVERYFQSLDPSVNPNAVALQEAAGFKPRGSGQPKKPVGIAEQLVRGSVGVEEGVVAARRKELVKIWTDSPEYALIEEVNRLKVAQQAAYSSAENAMPERVLKLTEQIRSMKETIAERSGALKSLRVNQRIDSFNKMVEDFMVRVYGERPKGVPRVARPASLTKKGFEGSAEAARQTAEAVRGVVAAEARKRPLLVPDDAAAERLFGSLRGEITEVQQRNRQLLRDAADLKEEVFAIKENYDELEALFRSMVSYSDQLAADLGLPTMSGLESVLVAVTSERRLARQAVAEGQVSAGKMDEFLKKYPIDEIALYDRLDEQTKLFDKMSRDLPQRAADRLRALQNAATEFENAKNAFDASNTLRESLPKTIEQATKVVEQIKALREANALAIQGARAKKGVAPVIRDESWMAESQAFVDEATLLVQSMGKYERATQASVSQYIRARGALLQAESTKTIAEREKLMLDAFAEMAKSGDPAARATVSYLGPTVSGVDVVQHLDRGFVALGNQYPSLQARAEIAEIIQNVHRLNDPAIVKELSKFLSVYTKYFKAYATLSPGFHVRNGFGNAFMIFAAGADVRNMTEGLRWSRLWYQASADGVTMEKFLMGSVPENMRDRIRNAILATRASGGGMTEEALLDATPFPAALTGMSRRLGRWLEQHSRFMLSYDGVARGMDMGMAAGRTRRFLVDYEDLSSVDRVMRQVVPFWMWVSRNFPLQIQTMWTNPKPYQVYNSIKRNLRDEENETNVPEWMQEMGAFKLPFGQNLYATPDFGFNRLEQNIAEFQDPARLLSQVNPLIRLPIELTGGRQLFSGRQFSEMPVEVSGGMSPVLQPLLEALGYGETGEGGKKFVDDKAYYALRNLIPLLATSERLSPSIPTGQQRGVVNPLLGFLGSPVRQLTPQMQESEMARRIRELQNVARRGRTVNAPQE